MIPSGRRNIFILYQLDVASGSVTDTKNPHVDEQLTRTEGGVDSILSGTIYKTYIDHLSHEKAQEAKGRFLFVEFPQGQTHTSIIHTSTLSDGSEIFTVRFGIVTLGSPRPVYNGIAVFRRAPDGNIQIQEPLKKTDVYSKDDKEETKATKEFYVTQLHAITEKIGEMSEQELLKKIGDSLIFGENGGHIYDISDHGKPGLKQFLVTFSNTGQNLECQVSVYKDGDRDIIEVHSLVREGDSGMLHFMSWFTALAVENLQNASKSSGLLQNEDTIDVYLTRDERHDIGGVERQNRRPLKTWNRIANGITERETARK